MNDEVLIAFLLSFPGIANLVATRGYPYGRLPQKRTGEISADLPAFTTNLISEESHHAIDADTARPELSCYRRMRFQVDIYGTAGADVWRVGEAIRTVADGFTGGMGSQLIGGVFGRTITPIEFIPDVNLYHRSQDYEVHAMG